MAIPTPSPAANQSVGHQAKLSTRQTMKSPQLIRAVAIGLAVGSLACGTAPPPRPAAPPLAALNASQPVHGILTAGQPTPEQLAEAARLGYRTVINLRSAEEMKDLDEAGEAARLGLRYVHIPVSGAADVTEENARALAKALADDTNYPILLHCASSNRAGALLAVKAHTVDGASPEDALTLGRAAGLTSLEPAVREKLGLPPAPPPPAN